MIPNASFHFGNHSQQNSNITVTIGILNSKIYAFINGKIAFQNLMLSNLPRRRLFYVTSDPSSPIRKVTKPSKLPN